MLSDRKAELRKKTISSSIQIVDAYILHDMKAFTLRAARTLNTVTNILHAISTVSNNMHGTDTISFSLWKIE